MVLVCVCSVRKTVHSRCYVCLDDPAGIPAFKAAVEKHVYVTDRGAQYRGVVEFAPYQGIPMGKVKRDPREGSLHKGEAQPVIRPCEQCRLLHLGWHLCLWSCYTYAPSLDVSLRTHKHICMTKCSAAKISSVLLCGRSVQGTDLSAWESSRNEDHKIEIGITVLTPHAGHPQCRAEVPQLPGMLKEVSHWH